MWKFYAIVCAFIILKIVFMFPVPWFYKLRSDHLSVFYGSPGSGKSTLACFYARKALAAGYKVFSNVPIIGCYKLEKEDIGKYALQHCLIIIDEAGIEYNNRDFAIQFSKKSGGHKALQFFKEHRHEHAEIMMFSQTFDDMDKKLFDLADRYYIVSKGLLPYPRTVVARRIKAVPDIDKRTDQPYDKYSFMLFGKKRIFAKPLWQYFDSYSTLGLPEKPHWEIYGQDNSDTEVSAAERSAKGGIDFDKWLELQNLPTVNS